MTPNIISKVLELDNCDKDLFIKVLYSAKFWETVSSTKKIEAKFISPNVLYTKMTDEIVNIKVQMEGELVLQDKGEQDSGKGRLIELNVRNNKDVKELEGHLRIRALSKNRSKLGIFIKSFKLSNDFANLIGKSVAELTLRTKLTEMLRKLKRWLNHNALESLL
ncbi:hypothetical protein LCGC14_0620890 [marine sediment metagenome]|uniref:Uncharacterized protein n=1 Tax=marine sediment metagenome TaxID=412755 RepID=A0A0F9R4W0_9ZZZZ|nr:MAG: hypothetical protein Lokiarch_36990 [Candidatus Lokiarchaeum sp. GC14_75]HEC39031.1 hypothetical protein [bacterium]